MFYFSYFKLRPPLFYSLISPSSPPLVATFNIKIPLRRRIRQVIVAVDDESPSPSPSPSPSLSPPLSRSPSLSPNSLRNLLEQAIREQAVMEAEAAIERAVLVHAALPVGNIHRKHYYWSIIFKLFDLGTKESCITGTISLFRTGKI